METITTRFHKTMENKDDVLNQILSDIKNIEKDTDNYRLPDHLANTLSSYMSMRLDIITIIDQTKLLIEYKSKEFQEPSGNNDLIVRALWHAIVITYGKFYSEASKSNSATLSANEVFKNDKRGLREVHDYLIDIRNNYIAHRGDTDHEQGVVYLSIPKGQTIGTAPKLEYQIKLSKKASTSHERQLKNLELFEWVKKIVEDNLSKKLGKIHERFLKEYDQKAMKKLLIK